MKGRSLIAFIFTCLAFFSCREQDAYILYHGKIFTANRARPFAEAVGVKGDRIVAVGDLNTVRASMPANCRLVDLQGHCLLPGFVDSHNHAVKGGLSLLHPNLYETLISLDSLFKFAGSALENKEGLSGDVLLIYGVNISTWSHPDSLERLFCSGRFAQQPLILRGSDGHTAWANTPMLTRAGIDRHYIDSLPPAQKRYFGLDQNGNPNGMVADSGLQKLFAAVPPPDAAQYKKAAQKALAYNNAWGITAWLDPAATYLNTRDRSILDAYQGLVHNHRLTAHVAALAVANANSDPRLQLNELQKLEKQYQSTGLLTLIGFKIFADGVLEYPTQTAALSKPYSPSGDSGTLLVDPSSFDQFVETADKANQLVHVHAIGDRAVSTALDAIAFARRMNGNSGIPHTITHLQIVEPSDFPRFRQAGVLASFQLQWAFGDITTIGLVKPYIDSSLYRWQYPARSMWAAGAVICGSSDWPVSTANPLEAIEHAETRKGPMGILDSSQCMPRLEMFYAYTINSARALRMDKEIGSLEPGKYADFVLVDRDVFSVSPEEMKSAKVLWTLFEGRRVYDAKQEKGRSSE